MHKKGELALTNDIIFFLKNLLKIYGEIKIRLCFLSVYFLIIHT